MAMRCDRCGSHMTMLAGEWACARCTSNAWDDTEADGARGPMTNECGHHCGTMHGVTRHCICRDCHGKSITNR